MQQSEINQAFINLIGIASIPFVIALIIFIIWLWFGIGTLMRLTDIKYLLQDIKYNLEMKDYKSKIVDIKETHVDETTETDELEDTIDKNRESNVEVSNIIKDLKNPSKSFLWLLGALVFIFIILLGIVLLFIQ